jgi:hypothetical protein
VAVPAAGTVRPPPGTRASAGGRRGIFGSMLGAIAGIFGGRAGEKGAGGQDGAGATSPAGARVHAGAPPPIAPPPIAPPPISPPPISPPPAAQPGAAHAGEPPLSREYTPPSVNLDSTMSVGRMALRPPPSAGPAAAPPPPPPPPAAVGGWIYVIAGPDQGRVVELSTRVVTIGRDPLSVLPLRDPSVSTTHAQVGFDGTRFGIQDLRSSNGTYVNNVSVTYCALKHGDQIRIGGTVLTIGLAGAT